MANGLRKLMKLAGQAKKRTLGRKISRIGSRLNVEQLEERIAPAVADVALQADEYVTWDTAAGGGITADDGYIGVGNNTTGTITVTVEDIDVATTNTTPDLTVTDSGGAGAKVIHIASNHALGNIDLSGISASATSITLLIETGKTITDAANVNIAIDGTAGTVDRTNQQGGSTAITGVGGGSLSAVANSGMGNIVMPSVSGTDIPIAVHIITNGTGAIGNVTSADTDLNLTDDAAGGGTDSLFDCGSLGDFNWAGEILPDADGVTFTVDNDSGTGTSSFIAGSITCGGAGSFTMNTEGIAGVLTITNGITVGAGAGGVAIDSDSGATDDGITGAVTIGGITITGAGAGDISINGGDSGFGSTISTGAINTTGSTGDADLTITTSTNGSFGGKLTTGAITNAGTNAAGNDIVIGPAGSGTMTAGFEATGLISNAAAAVDGVITIGSLGGAMGPVILDGITNLSTDNDGDISILGDTIGAITSSAGITAGSGTAGLGDILITADDGIGAINITGDLGGDNGDGGTGVTITADNGGTAGTGSIGTFGSAALTVSGTIGNGATDVAISFVDIGNISANAIGTGAGSVTFTADGVDATDNTGRVGNIAVTTDVASGAGGVTFTADDGIGTFSAVDVAQGGALVFNTNADGQDDAGSMGTLTAESLGDAATPGNDVTINTNGGATDNTVAQRPIGAITVTDGDANIDLTADGDIAAISVTGGDGAAGNGLRIGQINTNAAGDPTNAPDVTSITVGDSSGLADTLNIAGNIVVAGVMGAITVGDDDATDVITLTGSITIYAGDDPTDGFDADYAATEDSNVVINAAGITGVGTISANTRAASDLFTYTEGDDAETFQVTTASDVTGLVVFDPNGGNGGDAIVTLTDMAGTSSSDDIVISSTGSTEFDCGGITFATAGTDVRNITIEGDLEGNIGEVAKPLGDVQLVVVFGSDGVADNFYGNSLTGYASGDTLNTPGVDVQTLDTSTAVVDDIVIAAGTTFFFADAAGADNAVDQFNHHVGVVAGAAGATATLRGVDGSGDNTTDAEYTFDGNGASTAQTGATNAIDPNDLISGAALISRIILNGVGGLETDAAVREVDGTTNGSFFEFENNVGLFNLTTEIDTLSIGFDDNADLVDNAIDTSLASSGVVNRGADIDRLGTDVAAGGEQGLDDAVNSITNATAALGNMVVAAIAETGGDLANNVAIAVTGSVGPISVIGSDSLDLRGDFVTDDSNNSAAIAIGGDMVGDLFIRGLLGDDTPGNATYGADILIGIALDLNGDNDWADATEIADGNLTGMITIGGAPDTAIFVADNISNDIVIQGLDSAPEVAGLEVPGNLLGIKANGTVGDDQDDDIVVERGLEWVISDAALNADIFTGGAGADTIIIEGVTITGAAVLGATLGIDSATIIDHEAFGDTGDSDVINQTGGAITVQWTAGAFTDTADTIGDVYGFGGMTDLDIATATGDSMTVGNIFFLDNSATTDVRSDGDVGVIVVADDVTTIPTSETLQDLITTDYDVVNAPTALDTATGDDSGTGDLSFNGEIVAESVDGLVAEADITLTGVGISVDSSFGYMVALNGSIDATVANLHVGGAMGSIVASEDIDGAFVSEGPMAIDTIELATTLDTNFGLDGVPTWFTGGILAEAGNIGLLNDMIPGLDTGVDAAVNDPEAVFHALGQGTINGGFATFGDSMGTIYAPAGHISADIHAGGNFGGLQVPGGVAYVQLSVAGDIDRLLVPNFFYGQNLAASTAISTYDTDAEWKAHTTISAINGEIVVVVGHAYMTDNISVSIPDVAGAGDIVAIVNDSLATENLVETVDIYDGAEAGMAIPASTSVVIVGSVTDLGVWGAVAGTLSVAGDVADLVIDGAFSGVVDLNANYLNDTNGEVNNFTVTGTVDAAADLDAHNFDNLFGDFSAVTTTGTLQGRLAPTGNFTNLAGEAQTLFLDAGRNVTADWENVFGKMTEVTLSGNGAAKLLSVNGTFNGLVNTDLRTLRHIERDARRNASNSNLNNSSSAHLGWVGRSDSRVMLKQLAVDGELNSVVMEGTSNGKSNVNSLWVNGDAGTVEVGNILSNAFINGDVNNVNARIISNATVNGSAGSIDAWNMRSSSVTGTTTSLNISGSLVNSVFDFVVNDNVNRSVRSVVPTV